MGEPPLAASSCSSSTEDFCYVFMVELERGPSGLGMGLIDGMVSGPWVLTGLTPASAAAPAPSVNRLVRRVWPCGHGQARGRNVEAPLHDGSACRGLLLWGLLSSCFSPQAFEDSPGPLGAGLVSTAFSYGTHDHERAWLTPAAGPAGAGGWRGPLLGTVSALAEP